MNVIKNERVIFFDVDDTLVMWDKNEQYVDSTTVAIRDPYDGTTHILRKHEPHIKLLQNHLARGSQVVVWSQAGYQWVEVVLKALGFKKEPNLMAISKPFAYVDDLPAAEWMGTRTFLSLDSAWGRGK